MKTKRPALEVMTRGRAARSKPDCNPKSTAHRNRTPSSRRPDRRARRLALLRAMGLELAEVAA